MTDELWVGFCWVMVLLGRTDVALIAVVLGFFGYLPDGLETWAVLAFGLMAVISRFVSLAGLRER